MSAPIPSPSPVRSPVAMSAPDITEAEVALVTETLRSGCLSIGRRLEQFERQVAGLTGARHAVGVSSGTAGLHLAAIAAGVGPSDLVVTTPFSFVASSNCVLYEGADPVFVDVDPVTGNIDPALVADAVHDLRAGGRAAARWLPRSRRGRRARPDALKAVLPVHAFGQPAEMDPLADVARAHGLALIEDACEALGTEYRRRPAGTLGDAGVFAFYPNKQITTGEGGMLVTNRDDWAARFRALRNQGRDVMDAWLEHSTLGYNYRMSEVSAALGVAQLARLRSLLAARARVAAWYAERLANAPGIVVPTVVPSTTRMSWFVYVVRLHPDVDRRAVVSDLAEREIPTRVYFTPIHLQPFYVRRFGYRPGDFPIAEGLGRTCLALPFSGRISEADVDRVCGELIEVVARRRGRPRERGVRPA